MPGDGTGPEVVFEGIKVLKAVSEKVNFTYETVQFDFGGEHYKKTGETLPDSALDDLKKYDAIYEDYKNEITSKFSDFVDSIIDKEFSEKYNEVYNDNVDMAEEIKRLEAEIKKLGGKP